MAIILRNGSGLQIILPSLDGVPAPKPGKTPSFFSTGVKILYVDDEWLTVELGRNLLEALGYRVTALTSSLEARRVFLDSPREFDVVITDLSMPMMSGLELAADLVQVRPDLPVILYSGDGEALSPETARSLGIRAFLMKPASIADLVRAIRLALESPHP